MNRKTALSAILAGLTFVFGAFSATAQDVDETTLGQNCTSIMVGRLASTDGSVITSHTCDGKYRTWVTMEPAATHLKGSMHPVFKGTMKTSSPSDTTGVTIAGWIPEVPYTYAYLNTCYPSMNEHQLAIGETTFGGPDTLRNPASMFMIEELERVALQRCTGAREAIKLMGELAEEYGYGDGGECLTVADRDEVWQFEIIGCGKNSTGAVWVAKRVPDDCVAVSANVPRIGRLERLDRANFLCSSNVEQVALENGLWDGEGEFLFWKVYNCDYGRGRNYRERDWYILNALAPSLGLTQEMDSLPFCVKPENPVDVRDVMELLRATYEGTELSMCKNIKIAEDKISPVANPWLTTTMRNTLNAIAPGTVEFARTVSVAWCSYSTVIQLRSWLPDSVGGICWLSLDNPGQSPRIPVFCGNTTLPEAFFRCGQNQYDPSIALWQYRKANKLATLGWQRTKTGFMENVRKMEQAAFEGLPELEMNPSSENLDAYTAKIHGDCSALWQKMEADYWVMFGLGF